MIRFQSTFIESPRGSRYQLKSKKVNIKSRQHGDEHGMQVRHGHETRQLF